MEDYTGNGRLPTPVQIQRCLRPQADLETLPTLAHQQKPWFALPQICTHLEEKLFLGEIQGFCSTAFKTIISQASNDL